MDSSLQSLALVAAMANKALRKTLDVEDFDGRERIVAQALKDGKSKQARDDVKLWLLSLGITWDGSSDIGEVVIETLKNARRLQRARTHVDRLSMTLKYPNISGPQAVADALEAIKRLENNVEKGNG